MKTRFTFPAINLGAPIEPQLQHRAQWVGFQLSQVYEGGPTRWRLSRKDQVFEYDTLCEVNLKLEQLLEALGDRLEQQEVARVQAEQALRREALDRLHLAS